MDSWPAMGVEEGAEGAARGGGMVGGAEGPGAVMHLAQMGARGQGQAVVEAGGAQACSRGRTLWARGTSTDGFSLPVLQQQRWWSGSSGLGRAHRAPRRSAACRAACFCTFCYARQLLRNARRGAF